MQTAHYFSKRENVLVEQATVLVEPVVQAGTGRVLAYLARPSSRVGGADVVLAAMQAGRLRTLIAILRLQVAAVARRLAPDQRVLLPVCDVELGDPVLLDRRGPLFRVRDRVVMQFSARTMSSDLLASATFLTALQQTGYALALADVDGSPASLTLVREVMPEVVLLARDAARDRARLAATLAALSRVGSRVVATGVDTVEARDALAGQGCDLMCGPLFARALPASAWVG